MTIYDIAKEAGVSASTVSRVINNKPRINQETRERVLRIMNEKGFTLNETARGLSLRSSRFIGILIEDIRVPHHTESAYVIEQEMTRSGYTCITFSTGKTPEQKAEYIRILEQRRVDGVILIGSMFGTEPVKEAVENTLSEIPVAIANGSLHLPNAYNILVDEERGIMEATSRLFEKGRRRICFIMDVPTPSNDNKLAGFRKAHREGAEIRVVSAASGDLSPADSIERGRQAAMSMLSVYPDTDAVVCASDMLAIGCMESLQERGISVPEDISIFGIDNSLYGRLSKPKLSTVDNKLAEVSLNAARLLLKALSEEECPHSLVINPELVERESS